MESSGPGRVAVAEDARRSAEVLLHNFHFEAALNGMGEEKAAASHALLQLVAGNSRFCLGEQVGCVNNPDLRVMLRHEQRPRAVVLTCADSRCPPELILDQGLGDIFSIRVAGNVVDDHVLGSVTYALQHLGARAVVLLGHTRCGAVKAALADFVDSAKIRQDRSELGPGAAGDEAGLPAGGGSPRASAGRWLAPLGLPQLFQRVVGLLGGSQEAEKLVRTASFRDLRQLQAPINSIVREVSPAVRQVVMSLLDQEGPSRPPRLAGSPAHAGAGASPTGADPGRQAARCLVRSGAIGDGGGTPVTPEGQPMVEGMHHFLARDKSVGHNAIHRRLESAPEDFCLDTHVLECSNLLKEVAYQNVRRQCVAVWRSMTEWVDPEIMSQVLMATAIYDLDNGECDFFGLHA